MAVACEYDEKQQGKKVVALALGSPTTSRRLLRIHNFCLVRPFAA